LRQEKDQQGKARGHFGHESSRLLDVPAKYESLCDPMERWLRFPSHLSAAFPSMATTPHEMMIYAVQRPYSGSLTLASPLSLIRRHSPTMMIYEILWAYLGNVQCGCCPA